MGKKKPFEITKNADGTLTLQVKGVLKRFHDAKVLQSFGMQLYEQVSDRQTGVFHLQDADNGWLQIKFNTGEIISAKNYNDARLFASMIVEDTESMLNDNGK